MFNFQWLKIICNTGNIRLFLEADSELCKNKSYSRLRFIKTLYQVNKHEKIVEHEGQFVYSSFLPPIPSRAARQLIHGVRKGADYYTEYTHARRKAPISIYMDVTSKCPYHCAHCSAANRTTHNDMPTDVLKCHLKDMQDMGVAIIGLTGGEPMVRKDLVELIDSVDDRSVVNLFTSGVGLTYQKARELKKAGLFSTGISIDSTDKEVMDANRGKAGAFDTAVSAIKASLDASLYTMIQTVASKKMIENGELLRVVELARALGVHEVRVLEKMPSGRLIHISASNILSNQDREKLKKFHEELNKKKGYPKVTVFAHTEDFSRYGCGAGTQHSYIDSEGELYPCDFVPLSFGNINDVPLPELWKAMNDKIGTPRKQCMIMELYSKKLLQKINTYPVHLMQSEEIIKKLDKYDHLPGFYTMLSGKPK